MHWIIILSFSKLTFFKNLPVYQKSVKMLDPDRALCFIGII